MKKKLFYTISGIMAITSAYAQITPVTDTTPLKLINLNEVVFSANKAEEKKSDVPFTIEVIKSKEVELSNPQTSADMLSNTGNIMVQKSQAGGGSPIIRGFEANRVLIVVDGVRMNNAIYRAGHLQDVITVDNAILDRTEVIYGPSSVMYGSDAIGGSMVFYTKSPLFGDDKTNFKLNSYVRYASANQEKTGHADFNLGNKKLASFTSITESDFGDLRTGNARTPNADFGRCYYYVGKNSAETADSMIKNSNPNIQKFSGYSQMDFMEKLLYKANDNINIGLNVQYSSSSNIPRYDRSTEMSGSHLKYADWHYGHQNRTLTSLYSTIKSDGKLFDNLRLTIAMQNIDQERIVRKFSTDYRTNNNLIKDQLENVKVYSLNADFRKMIKEKQELSYGLEGVHNSVTSTAKFTNIVTNAETFADTRYPDGGNTLSNVGAYITHSWEINPKVILSDGLRYSYNTLTSKFTDSSSMTFAFPFEATTQKNQALNGNLGLVIMPEKNIRFNILGSTGFHAPNVDEMSKVFESGGGVIIVPNPDLKPEYAYNFDLGIATTAFDDNIKFEGSYFYTLLKNAIVSKDFKWKGNDSVVYGGVMSRVQANQNVDEANVQGVYGAITADLSENVSFKTSLTYTLGQYKDIEKDTILPLDHIPPMFGKTSLLYHFKKFESEIYAMYSAAKLPRDYSLGKEDNEIYSADPVNGYMPAWITLNIKTSYRVTNNFSVNLGVENIFDTHYRLFASGISAPGRNIILAIRVKF